MTEASIDSTIQPRAAFPDLPATHAVEQAIGSGRAARRQRVLILPVLANPLCEHHLVVYTADLAGERLRLVAFSKRESVDPKVPSRDWSELCRADMPAERIDEFVDLLQDRLHGAPLELQDIHPQDEATGEDEAADEDDPHAVESEASGRDDQVMVPEGGSPRPDAETSGGREVAAAGADDLGNRP